ncbi:MAG: hypothetical protein KC505_08900 [Myxococcales bacterium]|nr:hypothetical protein [Myxococcales bacterium]USN50555.1 MAG: hypothetical protein H6731_09870 [Myxococcales bacterium]
MGLYLVFAGLLMAALGNFADHINDALDNKIEPIVMRAENYLKNQHNIQDIGSLFLKKLSLPESVSERDVPLGDPFSRTIDQKYALRSIAIKRKISSLNELKTLVKKNSSTFSNYFYQFPPSIQKRVVHNYDDVLIKALYCDEGAYDELDLAILLSMRDYQGGYADTHSLLGIFFLEGNKCLSLNPQALESAKKNIIGHIIKALEKDKVYSDLYAERVACLFWAGAGHLVKKAWIDIIIHAQRADGGWMDPAQKQSTVHPTGLSYLSIEYYFNRRMPYFYSK